METTEPSPGARSTPEPPCQITLADDGRTLVFPVGAHILLALGWDDDWTVVVSDSRIVSRVRNIAIVRGAQGVYVAQAPGETDLIGTGTPRCRTAAPPCDTPDHHVRVHLVVREAGLSATPRP